MSRIDERLEAMGIDTSGMTDEQKFQAATGLTFYDETLAANDWYVPGGAANVKSEDNSGGSNSGSGEGNQEQTYTAEEAAAYNLTLDGAWQYGRVKTEAVEAIEAQNAVYSFQSFDPTGETAYGEGTVEVTELREDGATVKVLTNTDFGDSGVEFVGQSFNVNTLDTSKLITLYSTEGLEQPIAVRVTLVSEAVEGQEAQAEVLYTNEEVDAHNAELDGAVHAGDKKSSQVQIISDGD